jgi:hypothetical protein
MHAIFRSLLLAVFFATLMAACSNTSGGEEAGTETKDTGAWDADSRNNEDPSLGAKSITTTPRPITKRPTLDPTAAHFNTSLQMSRQSAELIVRMTDVPAAIVAITNGHVYVAVDPDRQSVMMQSKQTHSFVHDGAAGAGLFGSGEGGRLDWNSAKPLPKETAETIFSLMHRTYPQGNVYISTNPNFVNRMRFYEIQQLRGKSMAHYLNEFNTMIQYAFPLYGNGTNRMLTK